MVMLLSESNFFSPLSFSMIVFLWEWHNVMSFSPIVLSIRIFSIFLFLFFSPSIYTNVSSSPTLTLLMFKNERRFLESLFPGAQLF